ncbi:unnamed protein product [Victoria cruziana]
MCLYIFVHITALHFPVRWRGGEQRNRFFARRLAWGRLRYPKSSRRLSRESNGLFLPALVAGPFSAKIVPSSSGSTSRFRR